MRNKDYYGMSAKEFYDNIYNPMVSRYAKRIKHLYYEFGKPEGSLGFNMGIAFASFIFDVEEVLWYMDNFETGGLLDNYNDGRKNKRLISLCNLVFG